MAKKPQPAAPNTPPAAAAVAALSADPAAPIAAEENSAPGALEESNAEDTPEQPSGTNGPGPVPGLRITAAREGFRRAGRAWSKQPTDVPLADLSDDQVKLLLEEDGRMLTVEEVAL